MWSISQLFRIGLGPSSSHCIGPMRAALHFIESLPSGGFVERITVELYGSLAYTYQGHGTDKAIVAGLSGYLPAEIDAKRAEELLTLAQQSLTIALPKQEDTFDFILSRDLMVHMGERMGQHSNGLKFKGFAQGEVIGERSYFSIGGGFVINQDQQSITLEKEATLCPESALPYVFSSYKELVKICQTGDMKISPVMMANECAFRGVGVADVEDMVWGIIAAMFASMEQGLRCEGILPGGLQVERRALSLYKTSLTASAADKIFDQLNAYAMAINEENAAGCRVVTAPTNGASGVLPAVMRYYREQYAAKEEQLIEFLLTAAAIVHLYKKNASISGADVGCQGEVGVASSMAAGALTAVLGGDLQQIETASEIAMEHHLGMTCDPVAGLVQIPCIERNAMGALKAVNASRMALVGEHHSKVSLDQVIRTMFQTGQHMNSMYKETSQGGLAVNLVEC